jgi:Holliday junction resolvasome RuvABC endonuclease subunit
LNTNKERGVNGILALDLGIRLGWARLNKQGHFDTGLENLGPKRGETNGVRFLRFEAWLEKKIKENDVGVVAYEQVLTRHHSGAQAALANGFVAVLEKVAEERELELLPVANSTLKKHATGSGAADKADMILVAWDRWRTSRNLWVFVKPKKGVEHWSDYVRRKKVPSDDQVDAVWVLNWALGELGITPGSYYQSCPICKHPAYDHFPARLLRKHRCSWDGCTCERDLTDGELYAVPPATSLGVFDGSDVPCAWCGDPVKRIAINCLWAHAPAEPDKWAYKHLSCLQPGTESYKKGKALRENG